MNPLGMIRLRRYQAMNVFQHLQMKKAVRNTSFGIKKHKSFAKGLVVRENGLLQMIAKVKIFSATKFNILKNIK